MNVPEYRIRAPVMRPDMLYIIIFHVRPARRGDSGGRERERERENSAIGDGS